MEKKLRPLGCRKTISGRHIPRTKMNGGMMGYECAVYCNACGLIDDIGGDGSMSEYIFGKPKLIDDTKIL